MVAGAAVVEATLARGWLLGFRAHRVSGLGRREVPEVEDCLRLKV